MSCCITFNSTCGSQVGHMWVTSGLFSGLVGQIGQQVQPTFNLVAHALTLVAAVLIYAMTVIYWIAYNYSHDSTVAM